jgi:hypothetical protein
MPCQASLNNASHSPADAVISTRTEQFRQELNDMLVECVAVHSCQSSGTGKMHLACLIRKVGSILLFDTIGITITCDGNLDHSTACEAFRIQRS